MLVTDGGSGGLVRPDFAPGDFGISDYAVQAQIQVQGVGTIQNPSYALRIRGQGIDNNYGFNATTAVPSNDAASVAIFDNGGGSWLGGKRFIVFDPKTWHTYRIEVAGKNLEYLIDGVPVAAGTSDAWPSGGFGGITFTGAKVAVRNFSIISLSGTTLPAAAPCTPHCGTGGAQYAMPPSSFTAHNLLDWALDSGAGDFWRLQNGALVGSVVGSGGLIKPDYEPGVWNRADYAVEAQIAVLKVPEGGSPSFGVIARGQGIEKNYGYQASLIYTGSGWDAALYSRGGGQLARKPVGRALPLGSWHTIRIEVSGATQVRMLVDGATVLSGSDSGAWKYGGWAAVYFSGPQIAVRSFAITVV